MAKVTELEKKLDELGFEFIYINEKPFKYTGIGCIYARGIELNHRCRTLGITTNLDKNKVVEMFISKTDYKSMTVDEYNSLKEIIKGIKEDLKPWLN